MAIPVVVLMAMERVEVITGSDRRRSYGDDEKVRLVEGAFTPGVKVAEFAREWGVDPSLLYRWRRQMSGQAPRAPAFTPLTVFDEGDAAGAARASAPSGVVEMEFASGVRVRITGAADPGVIAATISALRGARR